MNEKKSRNLLKALKPDSLVKKCVYAICVVACVMLIMAGNLMTKWIYQCLKPEMQQDITVVTSAVATKISYLLHQNTQYLLKFWINGDLFENVEQYAQSGYESEELRQKIEDVLVAEQRGGEEPGAILSSRNVILIVDGEEWICKPEMEAYAQCVSTSQWFSTLEEDLKNLRVYEHDRLRREYSPAFLREDFSEEEASEIDEFIAFAMLKNFGEHTAILLMVEPFSEIRTPLGDFLNDDVDDFCMIGIDGRILFQNTEDSVFGKMTPEQIESLFVAEQYDTNLVEMGRDTVIGVRLSYQMEQLKLVTCVSEEDFLRPYQPLIRLIHMMMVVFTVILLILVIAILNHSLSKVKKLASQMEAVRGEAYRVPKSIQSSDEVGMLADTFYQMMDQIQENIEKLQEQEKREKKIEYSLLVSQIDPHFIYNTLNTITYLAELNQTEDIMIINKALIGMLRDRLKMTKLQIYDTLEKEKQQLVSYMTIQQYLCSSEISLEFPIEESCAKIQYPKNVLQPLVENAILHGILLHRDEQEELIPGFIEIHVTLSGEEIITTMEDNGIGMSDEAIRQYFDDAPTEHEETLGKETKDHIGIYNIRMRMRYLYGEKFQIKAERREESGLKITLRFPLFPAQERQPGREGTSRDM